MSDWQQIIKDQSIPTLQKLAEKFGIPLFCFIDTPGAYPGLPSEERGVAQAISQNLIVGRAFIVVWPLTNLGWL